MGTVHIGLNNAEWWLEAILGVDRCIVYLPFIIQVGRHLCCVKSLLLQVTAAAERSCHSTWNTPILQSSSGFCRCHQTVLENIGFIYELGQAPAWSGFCSVGDHVRSNALHWADVLRLCSLTVTNSSLIKSSLTVHTSCNSSCQTESLWTIIYVYQTTQWNPNSKTSYLNDRNF